MRRGFARSEQAARGRQRSARLALTLGAALALLAVPSQQPGAEELSPVGSGLEQTSAQLTSATPAPEMPPPPVASPYRADPLDWEPGAPTAAGIVLGPGLDPWSSRLRRLFATRVLLEWPQEMQYGSLQRDLTLWLDLPLLTLKQDGQVWLPVVRGTLPLEGRIGVSRRMQGRVMILIDASQSANKKVPLGGEEISVLELELRAVESLLDDPSTASLRPGLLAFGKQVWPIGLPGTPVEELRARLQTFREEHPRGFGRTDAVCALHTADQWLRASAEKTLADVLMLTDGDEPTSGRFETCDDTSTPFSREICLGRINRTPCPAQDALDAGSGSDIERMEAFARERRGAVRVSPISFNPERPHRVYRELASETNGRLAQSSSPEALAYQLAALLEQQVDRVYATNLTTGEATDDLVQSETGGFEGELALAPGPNDVELHVDTPDGKIDLYRFRVYELSGQLERILEDARKRNVKLEQRKEELQKDLRKALPKRRIDVAPLPSAP